MFLMTASPSFHTGVNEMYIVARGVLLGDCRVVVVVSSRKLPRTKRPLCTSSIRSRRVESSRGPMLTRSWSVAFNLKLG